MKTVVTTAYRPNDRIELEALRIADDLMSEKVSRRKRSIDNIHLDEQADVLVVAKERLEFYPMGKNEPFFFHPNSAAFRTKRPLSQDPLIEVSGLQKGDSFFDCTLGMASDAIVASFHVGQEGKVIGSEKHPVVAYVLRNGLQAYSSMPRLSESMQRITVLAGDAVSLLASFPDKSFDVIYMDPMFTEEIKESSNFTSLKTVADFGQLTDEWVAQAIRTAKRSVVLKAHFRSTDFERFGFSRRVRPNTKFHYGVIDCQ
ncbi:MAG TPA: class I SAM-dependent methyltransferase [Planococcus sp. (in: firmicutes)]|nr:class I SAM-dependent methyltransferase [Planococcus sp. (in: firmicutes)]